MVVVVGEAVREGFPGCARLREIGGRGSLGNCGSAKVRTVPGQLRYEWKKEDEDWLEGVEMWGSDPFPMTGGASVARARFMQSDKISPVGNGKEWIQGTWMDPLMDTRAEVQFVCRYADALTRPFKKIKVF